MIIQPVFTTTTPLVGTFAAPRRDQDAALPTDSLSTGEASAPTAPAPPLTTAAVNDPLEVCQQEASDVTALLPEWLKKYDDLTRTGANSALVALSSNPAVGSEVAAHFASNHLFKGLHCLIHGEDLKYLKNVPGGEAAVAAQLERFADFTLEQARGGVSPGFFGHLLDAMGTLVTAQPGIGRVLTEGQQQKLAALFQASLADADMGADGRDWDMISNLAKASVQLHGETAGRFPVDWMLQRFAQTPAASAVCARTCLDLERPVPRDVLQHLVDATVESAAKQTDRYYFYSQDFFQHRLLLLRDVLDKHGAPGERLQVAQKMQEATPVADLKALIGSSLTGDRPEEKADPLFRLKVGDQQFEFGTSVPAQPPAYERCGPEKREDAIKGLTSREYVSTEEFFDVAGDQALLALGGADASVVAPRLAEMLHRKWGGDLFARDVFSRLETLQPIFPKETAAAVGAWVKLLHDAIGEGGQSVESISYYLDNPVLTADQRRSLLADELALHRRAPVADREGETSSVDSRIQRRGLIFQSLCASLDSAPARSVPADRLEALRASLANSREEGQRASFQDRARDVVEYRNDWALKNPEAKAFLEAAPSQ